MHVMVCANSCWTIWNFRRAVIEALIDDGHKVTVVAPADDTSYRLTQMGCHTINIKMDAKGINPIYEFSNLLEIRKIIKSEKADAILSYTIKSNIYCAIVASQIGLPSLPNITGLGTAFLSGKMMSRFAEILFKYSFRNSPYVFMQNPDDVMYFVSKGIFDPARVITLPGSGIDLGFFKPAPMPSDSTTTRILMISRVIRQKGVLEFVGAARLIKKLKPDVQFQILGDLAVQNRSAIPKSVLDGWIDEGIIEYLGTSVDVRPHIARADCVVLPSYREGAPRALIEAAAMARPVITTDVPGCRSVVEDGVSGFLCAARSVESLADATLRFLVLSRESRSQMGLAGRKKMEREFDQSRVIDAYRRALAELPRKIAYLNR